MTIIYTNYQDYNSARDKEMRLATEEMTLGKQMDATAARYGEDSKEYRNVKKAFDAKQKEHTAAKADFDKVKQEIDDYEGKKQRQEQRKKDAEKATTDITTLEAQRDAALRRNDTAGAQAAQEKIDALKPKTEPKKADTPPPANAANPYADPAVYTLTANGVSYKGIQTYLVTVPDAAQGQITTGYTSIAQARAAYVKAYASTPEQVAALKKQLVASGYATNADINSDTWYTKLDDAIVGYTTHTVQTAQFNGAKQPDLPTEFLKIKRTGAGNGSSGIQHTTRGTAKQAIDAYANDFLGRSATPEEADAYYKDLIKAETAGGTSGVVSAEVTMIAANTLRKSLKGTNVDDLLKNASGSAVATDISDLQQTAAKYGVAMTAADALKYVAAGFGQKDYLAKQEERIKQTAIALHPQLKDHFLAGGTYKDIADQYKYAKQSKLGVVIDNSANDNDIADAIAKGMSITDFKTALQSKPEWRKSPEAHDMVNSFINNIAQTWGLG
jgi:hypothetical protein